MKRCYVSENPYRFNARPRISQDCVSSSKHYQILKETSIDDAIEISRSACPGDILALDSKIAKDTAVAVAQSVPPGVALKLGVFITIDMAISIANAMSPGSTLMLNSDISQPYATAISESMNQDAILLLNPAFSKYMVMSIASYLKPGAILAFSSDIRDEETPIAAAQVMQEGTALRFNQQPNLLMLYQVATALLPNTTLWLPESTPEDALHVANQQLHAPNTRISLFRPERSSIVSDTAACSSSHLIS